MSHIRLKDDIYVYIATALVNGKIDIYVYETTDVARWQWRTRVANGQAGPADF